MSAIRTSTAASVVTTAPPTRRRRLTRDTPGSFTATKPTTSTRRLRGFGSSGGDRRDHHPTGLARRDAPDGGASDDDVGGVLQERVDVGGGARPAEEVSLPVVDADLA